MKKLLIPVLMSMFCAPVFAQQNLPEFVEELGYTDPIIYQNLVTGSKHKAAKKQAVKKEAVQKYASEEHLSDPDDLLKPRVMDAAESPDLIPTLMRYHRENPTSDKITRKLAVTCLNSGQFKEALHWYTLTWQRNRSDFESLWNMASIAYGIGNYKLAGKYLEEYASLDPNSGWGRMAKDFLKGRFNGSDMKNGFTKVTPRYGDSSGSSSSASEENVVLGSSSPESGNGIIVIEGKRTDFSRYMSGQFASEDEADYSAPVVDASKGKIGINAEASKEKNSSLQKAQIRESAAQKTNEKKTVAESKSYGTDRGRAEADPVKTEAEKVTAEPLVP